jgi:hypothetical protein
MAKTVLSVVGVLAVLVFLAAPASAVSVTSGLTPGDHVVQFGGVAPTFAHADVFATSNVTPAGAPGDPVGATNLGAVVFDDVNGNGAFDVGQDKILRVTLATNSILYGGGEATFTVDGGPINTGTELTFAFGNLYATEVQVHPGNGSVDATTAGVVTGLDALLCAPLAAIGGTEFADTNADNFIDFGSVYDLDGVYGDYNRDGVATPDFRDRPFIAVWESDANTYSPNQSPVTDADGDGVTVDDLWVGDPWTAPLGAPVDVSGDGNAIADADPGLTDDSYGKLLALFALDTVLPVGGLRFGTATSVNALDPTNPATPSRVDIVGVNNGSGLPWPGKAATVELVGGRLFDLLTPSSNKFFSLTGQYQFDPLDLSPYCTWLEFTNTPTLRGGVTVIPEPATLGLLLTSMGGLAGLRLRRRKRQ